MLNKIRSYFEARSRAVSFFECCRDWLIAVDVQKDAYRKGRRRSVISINDPELAIDYHHMSLICNDGWARSDPIQQLQRAISTGG
jgi:hypothetical protein